jgi:hypothetical protein
MLFGAALVLSLSGIALAGEASVKLQKNADTVAVTIGGEEFTFFNFGKSLPKPFFSPVRGPGGVILSRSLENPADHPHHKGIWLSVDEVNGIKFWAEKGKIENAGVEIKRAEGDPAELYAVNRWLNEQGELVVTEKTTISLYANRLVVYDITFTADAGPVEFEDTKEGLFGFRMVDSMREKEGGKVVNADGAEGTKACWGQPSAWVDYYGPVDGKTFGVAIFDDPTNFRKSRYHVRDYGLFSINPFGEKAYTGGKSEAAHVQLPAGGSRELRYGMYFHTGDTKAGRVAEVYREFAKPRAAK